MTTAHTPGPWEIGKNRGGMVDINALDARIPWQGLARVVVEMEGMTRLEPYGEGEANARLIAAAPELLEALEWALAEISGTTKYDSEAQFENCLSLANDAIAKARGEA